MKNLVNHKQIDKELTKLPWALDNSLRRELSPYYAYGMDNVTYKLKQIHDGGESKFIVRKLLQTGTELRALMEPASIEAAKELSERDYRLRHANFKLAWGARRWGNRITCALRCKYSKDFNWGTVLTATYEGKTAVKVILVRPRTHGLFVLRAKFADGSDLPVSEDNDNRFFKDVKELPAQLEEFKKLAARAFKCELVRRQIEYSEGRVAQAQSKPKEEESARAR